MEKVHAAGRAMARADRDAPITLKPQVLPIPQRRTDPNQQARDREEDSDPTGKPEGPVADVTLPPSGSRDSAPVSDLTLVPARSKAPMVVVGALLAVALGLAVYFLR
jgi:hypothetical protein